MPLPRDASVGLQREAETLRQENAELKRALQQARDDRDAMHRFLDASVIAITQLARDGTILMINQAGARNLGGTPATLQGQSILDLIPALAEQTRCRIEQALNAGKPVLVETTVKLPAGERCFRSTYRPVYGAEPQEHSVQLVSQDITELKHLEQALEATEGKLASILEHAPHIVAILDRDGAIRYVNRAPPGYSMAALLNAPPIAHIAPDAQEPFRQGVQSVLEGAGPVFLELDSLAGEHWEVRLAPILRRGRVEQVLLLAVDVSDRAQARERERQLEAQVQHAQKLESLGVLAGGIAHDFNNLLVGILGNAELARARTHDPDVVRCLGDIAQAGKRAAELCRQMLAYAGRGNLSIGAVDLSQVAREMLDLLRASVSKQARLFCDCPEGLPMVEGDSTQLGQVVMNLLTNASDALGGERGEISLRCGVVEDEGGAPRVFVEVRDNGIGMDAETRERMFEPFFTTKNLGNGLGLAAVQGIVSRHHGTLVVDSEPGAGTTIRVLLPVAAPGRTHDTSEHPSVSPSKSTILVVDDEPMVRSVTQSMLEQAGHRVLVAADGAEALVRFDSSAGAIDAVVLDLDMPGMTGRQTLDHLRERNAALPIVLVSGFSVDPAGELPGPDDRLTGFLPKPFGVQGLLAALHRVLPQ